MGLLVVDGHIALGMAIDEWRAGPLMQMAAQRNFVVPPTSDVADVEPLPAFVNAGRWSVLCPDCGGSEYAWKGRGVMMCASCWNGMTGHQWRPVVFPENVGLIEAILAHRPMLQTQNWLPGETLDQLQAENLIHGARIL